MKIATIECSRHRIPLEPPFHPAWDGRPRTEFEVALVRVTSDEGHVGIGSGDLMPGFEGHEGLFVGQDPLDLERHFRLVDNLSFHYGRCWPLDVALWDLAGAIRNEPCWRMLGAVSGRVRTYASSGTLREPAAMAEQVVRLRDDGFPAVKLRFQRADWRDDLAVLEAVRKAVGDSFPLMVDCNQGWRMPWDVSEPRSLGEAIELGRRLQEFAVHWMEEPLHRGDLEGHRRLRDAVDVPVAGGELAREVHEIRRMVATGCLDVAQPDVVLVGGFSGLAPVAELARTHGVEFTPHTWGNGIGLLANAHLAAAAGSKYLEYPYDPPEWTPERRDFPLAAPLVADDEGWLELPAGPGLGLELDEERLAATRL